MLSFEVVKFGRNILDCLPDNLEQLQLVLIIKREFEPKFQWTKEVVDGELDYVRRRNLDQPLIVPDMAILFLLILIVLGKFALAVKDVLESRLAANQILFIVFAKLLELEVVRFLVGHINLVFILDRVNKLILQI